MQIHIFMQAIKKNYLQIQYGKKIWIKVRFIRLNIKTGFKY